MNDAEKLRKITEERRIADRAAITETLEDLYQNIIFLKPKQQLSKAQKVSILLFLLMKFSPFG